MRAFKVVGKIAILALAFALSAELAPPKLAASDADDVLAKVDGQTITASHLDGAIDRTFGTSNALSKVIEDILIRRAYPESGRWGGISVGTQLKLWEKATVVVRDAHLATSDCFHVAQTSVNSSLNAPAVVDEQAISEKLFVDALGGDVFARNVFKGLVSDALIDAYARQKGISVSEEDLSRAEQQFQASSSTVSWAETLRSLGTTDGDMRTEMRRWIVLDRALNAHASISLARTEAYFDSHRSSFDHPEMVKVRELSVEGLASASHVRSLLLSGMSFAVAWKQYAMPLGCTIPNGELGWVPVHTIPKATSFLSTARVGSISPPILSVSGPYGSSYDIFQVTARVAPTHVTLADVRDSIEFTLRQQDEAPFVAAFIATLAKQASIQVSDHRFDGVF